MATEFRIHKLELPEEAAGQRLDQALAVALPQYSRARLQRWIRSGAVRLGEQAARARDRVHGGEQVVVEAQFEADDGVAPESLPLEVTYQDADVLVLVKPAGLVVHPGAGNRAHTLQNALLAHDPELARVPRAGLVHRLDKDTSGLLVIARTPEAHTRLVAALAQRQVGREYLALVWGLPTGGARIDEPIGRSRRQRTRMTIRSGGREAVTHYRIEERLRAHTLLRVQLETGRTHQIRVHLAHVGLPIVGDPVYGGRPRLVAAPQGLGGGRADPRAAQPVVVAQALNAALLRFRRQALHAQRLSLAHPRTGRELNFEAPLPADFVALLAAMRLDCAGDGADHGGRARGD